MRSKRNIWEYRKSKTTDWMQSEHQWMNNSTKTKASDLNKKFCVDQRNKKKKCGGVKLLFL